MGQNMGLKPGGISEESWRPQYDEGSYKGCISLYMKLCNFTLLFMILQVE